MSFSLSDVIQIFEWSDFSTLSTFGRDGLSGRSASFVYKFGKFSALELLS